MRFLTMKGNVVKPPAGWRVYFAWLLLAGLAALPLANEDLKPLWKVLCWIGPTFLALDVDARNHRWVYIVKGMLWVIMSASALAMLKKTKGFEVESGINIKIVWPLVFALLAISCSVTIIGYRYKEVNWSGWHPNVKHLGHLGPLDEKTYFDEKRRYLLTKLKLQELRGATVQDGENGYRELSAKEVSDRVLHISRVTEYVMRRVYKTDRHQVLLYSMVTQFRALLAVIALLLAGLWHVFSQLFETTRDGSLNKDQGIVDSLILWLTIPTLTLPNMVRLYFGQVQLSDFIRGLLPGSNDKQIWERLNISPEDFYTALTNAVGHEGFLQERIGLLWVRGTRPGFVRIRDLKKAKKLCLESLLRIGNYYVRVSDGRPFVLDKRGEARVNTCERQSLCSVGDSLQKLVKKAKKNGDGVELKDVRKVPVGADTSVVLTLAEEDNTCEFFETHQAWIYPSIPTTMILPDVETYSMSSLVTSHYTFAMSDFPDDNI